MITDFSVISIFLREEEKSLTLNNHRVEGIYNVMESIVWMELDRIVPNYPDICFCPLCKSDIIAYALNRLTARYVSTEEGERNFKDFERDERVHEVVSEAITHVSMHPHRANRTMTEYTVNELFAHMDKSGRTV